MDWVTFLSWFTGFALLDPDLPAQTLVLTVAIVHLCDGIACRLIASNNGYPTRLWLGLGFVFGIWALATLLVLPNREEA